MLIPTIHQMAGEVGLTTASVQAGCSEFLGNGNINTSDCRPDALHLTTPDIKRGQSATGLHSTYCPVTCMYLSPSKSSADGIQR